MKQRINSYSNNSVKYGCPDQKLCSQAAVIPRQSSTDLYVLRLAAQSQVQFAEPNLPPATSPPSQSVSLHSPARTCTHLHAPTIRWISISSGRWTNALRRHYEDTVVASKRAILCGSGAAAAVSHSAPCSHQRAPTNEHCFN